MTVRYETQVGSAVVIARQPYFLGGEHRQVFVNDEQRLSIIPQPKANGVHSNLFEIATIRGERLDVVEAYCSEERVAQIVGEMVLNGSL